MKPLCIGQFSDSFPPLMDGVGQTVTNYCTHLIQKGYICHAVVAGCPVDEGYAYDAERGIDYTIRAASHPVAGIKPYGITYKDREFRRRVHAIDYDIVHSHSPFSMGPLGEEVRRVQHVPLIATFHTLFKDDILGLTHSHFITDQVMKRILPHFQGADEVWTPTEWSRCRLYEYGVDRAVEVIANGCDMPIPTEQEYLRYREAGRRYLGLNDDRPVLIYIGQLKEEKNLTLLVNALAQVPRQETPFLMVFVGTGSDRGTLERLAQRSGMASYVQFTGRITDREVIKALLAASLLMLFPSQYDTSALVLFEAAAFSVPLVNTRGSATASCTTHGHNGFVTANDAASFGEEITRLLRHPHVAKDAGIGASRTIYRHWSTVVDEVAGRYEDVYGRFSPPRRQ
ncbi:MAG: glycosyltransferase [Sphaerochaeta sp.]|nr:glycosyltransferase [Sphaerochaeta sp.]